MPRLPFQTALLLAPLTYALHHFEEHVVFNFRAWRLRYFADNNHLSTEAVLCILITIGMVYVLLHATIRSRRTAAMAVLFLMATQVHNILFHVGGTLVFGDFSPGTYTALGLYLPANLLVVRSAIAEGHLTPRSSAGLFVAGGAIFWAFEVFGPVVLVLVTSVTWAAIAVDARKSARGRSRPA